MLDPAIRAAFLSRIHAPRSLFAIYVVVVTVLGAAGFVAAAAGTQWSSIGEHVAWWPVAFLAVAALVGELKPLYIQTKGALHNPGCSRGLNPPDSRSDLAT